MIAIVCPFPSNIYSRKWKQTVYTLICSISKKSRWRLRSISHSRNFIYVLLILLSLRSSYSLLKTHSVFNFNFNDTLETPLTPYRLLSVLIWKLTAQSETLGILVCSAIQSSGDLWWHANATNVLPGSPPNLQLCQTPRCAARMLCLTVVRLRSLRWCTCAVHQFNKMRNIIHCLLDKKRIFICILLLCSAHMLFAPNKTTTNIQIQR